MQRRYVPESGCGEFEDTKAGQEDEAMKSHIEGLVQCNDVLPDCLVPKEMSRERAPALCVCEV